MTSVTMDGPATTSNLEGELVAPPNWSGEQGPGLPHAPKVPRTRPDRNLKPILRRAASVIIGVVLVALVQFQVVAPLIFEQRQQHLAAELKRPLPTVVKGGALGVIQIPGLGVNRVVIEGVSVENLRSGPAHMSGSALPGDAGVMVIFGHRSGYGGPFEKVATMKQGDSFVLQARNNGPIVRYIVDRVERKTSLNAVVLDKTDRIAYALLVTGEEGILTNGQVVVIARALPVTTTPSVVPDLSAGVSPGVPFGLETLLAFGSVTAAVLATRFLVRRGNRTTAILVGAPIATYAAIRLMMTFDAVLAIVR